MRKFLEKSFKNHENPCRIVLSFEDPLKIFLKAHKKSLRYNIILTGEDYYRGAKVSFVSNHNGTTALEVMSISLAPELGVLISALFTVLVGAVSAAAAASTNKRSASITQ